MLTFTTTLTVIPEAKAFTRVGALTLNPGEDKLFSAVIDSANGFAYFGTGTSPGVVVKVRLSDFTRVGALTLNTGEVNLLSAVIDSANGFAYFGTFTSPGVVVKVSLSDFTRVGALTLNPGEDLLLSAVIDSANGFAYFGTFAGIVVKVSLSDFTRVGALTLNAPYPQSAVIDSANGFAYFGAATNPGIVVKVSLSDFTRVGALTLNTGEGNLFSAVIDSANGFAYFGAATGVIVKVSLSDFTRVGGLILNINNLSSAVIDSANGFAYFGTYTQLVTSPGVVVKVSLSDFTRVGVLTLNTGENFLTSAVFDSAGSFAYFGTETSPGIIVKIDIAAAPPPSFDFSLSNSGSISVQQGSSGSNTVTATLTDGTAEAVALSCVASSLPVSASCSFNPSSVTPSSAGATSELTVFTTSVTPTGSFQVQVTGSPLGATTTPTTFTLTVTPPSSSHATFTAVSCGPPTVAVNDVTSCFAAVIDTASGPTTPTGTVTFTPSGTCILAGTGTGASATCLVGITPTATGSLSVSASYDGDSTHAASSGKFFITVSPGVAVTISSNPTVNSPLTFTATVTGGTVPYSFSWDFGDGTAAGTTNPVIHTYATMGTKTVTLTVTDSASATVVLSQTVNVAGPSISVSFTAGANPTVGSPVTFTATVTGGTSPYTFSWDFGDGSLSGTGNPVTHTYDSSGAKTVTLGVTDASGGSVVLSDTWEFTAGTWTQLSSSTSPSPRFLASTAYDVADGYVLLFGGSNNIGGTSVLGDTWEFHAGIWTQLSPTSSPSPRAGASMVYDAADGYVLLFGGVDGNNTAPLGDTWEFHAGAWTQLFPSSSPSSHFFASMVYDEADQYVLLFGGNFQSDTWEFHAGTWTQLSPSSHPSPRLLPSTAYDAGDGYVVLFGGSDITSPTTSLGDTWKFQSSVWTLLSPTSSPSPRAGASMVYDSADGYVLLFGGSLQGDTWEFHAGAWTQPSPPTSPSSRAVASMAYNDADRQAVLFGGVGASPPTQSTTTINVAGQLLPPAQASQNLIDAIKSIQLPGSAQTSLLGPLNNIVKILSDKDPTNDISACNKLSSFINIVNNDQRKGILTIEQAAQLRQLATSIMTQLGC